MVAFTLRQNQNLNKIKKKTFYFLKPLKLIYSVTDNDEFRLIVSDLLVSIFKLNLIKNARRVFLLFFIIYTNIF